MQTRCGTVNPHPFKGFLTTRAEFSHGPLEAVVCFRVVYIRDYPRVLYLQNPRRCELFSDNRVSPNARGQAQQFRKKLAGYEHRVSTLTAKGRDDHRGKGRLRSPGHGANGLGADGGMIHQADENAFDLRPVERRESHLERRCLTKLIVRVDDDLGPAEDHRTPNLLCMMAEHNRDPFDAALIEGRDDGFKESSPAVEEQGLVLPH